MIIIGQDVDLRSLGNGPDPRMARMADQDMRQIPVNVPMPTPAPVVEP